MPDPDEPPADGELPLPGRPAADVLVPPLRAAELRRELQRLEHERERAQHELGGMVVAMAREGVFSPAALADGAAAVRSRQDQIDAITAALEGKTTGPLSSGTSRRATLVTALVAVALFGAVAGAWIERRQQRPAAALVPVPTVLTETFSAPVAPAVAAPSTTDVRSVAVGARGGHAVVRRR